MADPSYIYFNKSLQQCRDLGARGGRAYGRNLRHPRTLRLKPWPRSTPGSRGSARPKSAGGHDIHPETNNGRCLRNSETDCLGTLPQRSFLLALMPEGTGSSRRPGFFGALLRSVPARRAAKHLNASRPLIAGLRLQGGSPGPLQLCLGLRLFTEQLGILRISPPG
jgi:hypothetical protein